MKNTINELFAFSTFRTDVNWQDVIEQQQCPFIEKKCVKIRKSQPEISIGTCSVNYGRQVNNDIVICPHRFLYHDQVFFDCIHLLTLHEPGNQLHKIPEVEIPGGSVDYFLVSAIDNKVIDFVGIELQALDTTGTVWPARQQLLQELGIIADDMSPLTKPFGMNWKMTAKTTLLQLHHKIETFEDLGKHLVLVLQDVLMQYMRGAFNFNHIQNAKVGHSMHFHEYRIETISDRYQLKLSTRTSTDTTGIASALGLKSSANVEMEQIIAILENKLSETTLLSF